MNNNQSELRDKVQKCFTDNDMTEDGCSDFEDIELFDTDKVLDDLVALIEARETAAIRRFADNIYPEVASAFTLSENPATTLLLKTVESVLNEQLTNPSAHVEGK